MEKQQLRVELLGTSFTIQSSDDPEYLGRLVTHLRERIAETKETYPFADPVTIALLTALNLVDELLRRRPAPSAAPDGAVDEVAQRLMRRVDEALGDVAAPRQPT